MKYFIASDLHGSSFDTHRLLEFFKEEGGDTLILLGDLYYHGPRNPFPEEYQPMTVAEQLNEIKDKLLVIRGNCDSAVDEMISDFDFADNMILDFCGKKFFLTHGHIYNEYNLPKTRIDGIFYGHLHTGFIEEKGGIIVANPGSVSLPKNGTEKSFIVLDEKGIHLRSLTGKLILEKEF